MYLHLTLSSLQEAPLWMEISHAESADGTYERIGDWRVCRRGGTVPADQIINISRAATLRATTTTSTTATMTSRDGDHREARPLGRFLKVVLRGHIVSVMNKYSRRQHAIKAIAVMETLTKAKHSSRHRGKGAGCDEGTSHVVDAPRALLLRACGLALSGVLRLGVVGRPLWRVVCGGGRNGV